MPLPAAKGALHFFDLKSVEQLWETERQISGVDGIHTYVLQPGEDGDTLLVVQRCSDNVSARVLKTSDGREIRRMTFDQYESLRLWMYRAGHDGWSVFDSRILDGDGPMVVEVFNWDLSLSEPAVAISSNVFY